MNESKKSVPAFPNWHNGNLQRKKSLEERFWEQVDKISSSNGCWIWKGNLAPNGYGRAWLGHGVSAHRASWLINRGAVPNGLQVLHDCRPGPDNRACVNPEHLWIGTQKDNIGDAINKGRMASGARNGKFTHPEKRLHGVKNGLSKLTDDMVREIRKSYANGDITLAQAGKPFGVMKSDVWCIVHRKTWQHVQ